MQNNKITGLKCMTLIILMPGTLKAAEGILRFKAVTEHKTNMEYMTLRRENNDVRIDLTNGTFHVSIWYDSRGHSRKMVFNSNDGKSKYIAEQHTNIINITGYTNKVPVDIQITAETSSWHQMWKYGKILLGAPQKKILFFTINAQTLQIMKFVYIKKEKIIVRTRAGDCQALKVKLTLPDFRAVFWSSEYIYRLSDGMMVSGIEKRGGPGTPKTRVTLLNENL